MAEPRRSGRQRKANPRYANDGWDKETLRILRGSSESSDSHPDEEEHAPQSKGNSVPDSDPSPAQSEDEEESSIASAASEESLDAETPDEDEGGTSSASDDNGSIQPVKVRPFLANTIGTARSRAIQYPHDLGKAESYPAIFGPDVEDLNDILRARDTWLKARDVVLPSRQTLSLSIAPSENSTGTDQQIRVLSEPEKRHVSRQILTSVAQAALEGKYLPKHKPTHAVVLGPSGEQQKCDLSYLSALDFGKAWKTANQETRSKSTASEEARNEERYHDGWLLNAGEKVQTLAWAPGFDSFQYLAVAVRCTFEQRQSAQPSTTESQAFKSSPLYPSSIQIWEFETTDTATNGLRTLAMRRPPRLVVVLATGWGNIRLLRWCPHDDSAIAKDAPNCIHSIIGLLGILSSDGHARVVAVPFPHQTDDSETIARRVDRAAIDIPPPADTIFTTLAFAGQSDLLLGTAKGAICIFDLAESPSKDNTTKSYSDLEVHHTYIVSLCSASAPHSTVIASASASGELVLTDLRSPKQDRVAVSRSCFPARDLIYTPFTRSILTVLDRSGNSQVDRNGASLLACHHIRQFPSLLKVAKLPHRTGLTTALAGSNWHPCILVGNAKGDVLATNYLRKILPYPRASKKKIFSAYLQKICQYDWRPITKDEFGEQGLSRDDESASKEGLDVYHGRDARPGMSRFHEGFKPEQIDLAGVGGRARRDKTEDKTSGEAIFEEEQAVTAIEWNPNAGCAGLVAVGWGSGIVRVQDLAYEAARG